MTSIAWHTSATRAKLTEVVREIESKTSTELVVTVRPESGDYTGAASLAGSLAALVGLCVYLYVDAEFTDDLVAPLLVLVHLAAWFFAARVPGLLRALTPVKRLTANVRSRAREAFVDQGIATTRERSGLLLYVSVLERRAEAVADIGITRRDVEGKIAKALEGVTAAVAADRSLDDVLAALRELGACLERELPRAEDDVNELPDEVTT